MKYLLALLALSAATHGLADKPLDFWDEAIRLFSTAQPSRSIAADLPARRKSNFKPRGFSLDHADQVVGDFSIAYSPADAGMPARFGFVAGLWNETWPLSPAARLNLWIKAEKTGGSDVWKIRLIDSQGAEANGELPGISAEWKELSLPLNTLKAAEGFDWTQVTLCEFDEKPGREAIIRFDGIRFEDAGRIIGVTGKPLTQRMAEAEASRTLRVETALREQAGNTRGLNAPVAAFAKMYLNEDLETANQLLVDELNKSSDSNAWNLLYTSLYCRFYYFFSDRCGKFPGRMTPETEKLLLETLWDRTASKNDIHWARQSTWYLDGSENHDLNAKACNLITSHIFMNEPDYKDRIYPDYGFGGGYHYGHAGYYGPGIDPDTRHGGGRANLSDGKKYNAKDHYNAWLSFMKTYFRERAERGFFLEYGAQGYSKHTLNFVDLAQHYSGDAELSALLDDFQTLYWAEWAQVSISGTRGGPKTRHHGVVGGMEDKQTADLISFHLGGPANAGVWWYWNLINDYRLPPIVWKMALDRNGMGSFVYQARGIGEENNQLPRPLGAERSLVVDTDARFLKYTYVTPDYTLGTQMDHPSAVHSHLSLCGRWHGMTFAQSPSSRIVPVGIPEENTKKGNDYDLEVLYHTVQHENTLILQQARRWFALHPEWFPADDSRYKKNVGIWIGKDWGQRRETNGWIFVQQGNAYAAVRPVLWDEKYEKENKVYTEGQQRFFNAPHDPPTVKLRTDCYSWNEDQTLLLLEDNHTAVILEAGRKADYPALEDFMAAVLDNPIKLYKTVVPGYNILVYTGCGKNAKEIVFNIGAPEIPTVGGEPINYSYPMTFDSPYLKSEYKSGKIRIEYGGETLNLDF
jgi:hypothetical protein